MPTAKPRLIVTMEPETYRLLKRFAALSGSSMSAIVSSMLEPAVPSLHLMLDAAEAHHADAVGAQQALAASLDLANDFIADMASRGSAELQKARQSAQEALSALPAHDASSPQLTGEERPTGRTAAVSAKGSSRARSKSSPVSPPPSSNTGVGFRSQGSAKGIRRGKL